VLKRNLDRILMKTETLKEPDGQEPDVFADATRGYSTWQQVAGYFDGDGCPKIHVGVFTLHVTVSWSDQYRELLEHIYRFLSARGAVCRMGEFRRGPSTYYELTVTEGGNALLVLKAMLPFLDKKWSQVNAAVSYLEDKINGDDFIRVLNDAVLTKRRSSSIIDARMPYTKRRAKGMRTPRPASRALKSDEVKEAKQRRDSLGLTYQELAKIYGVSAGTIHRAFRLYLAT
jgi:hypothetical protein